MSLATIRARAAATLAKLAVLAVLLASASAAPAAEQWMTLGGLRVAVWSDAAPDGPAQPVIVFSHGYLGCATQSRFLMEAFAKAGYIVFAPNHGDAMCVGPEGAWPRHAGLPLPLRRWNDGDFRNRADDIGHLLEAIRDDDRFRTNVDLSRLGLVGHSLGGYTVLGLGGAWPSWKLPGVSAVLALSPFAQPYIEQETLHGLSVPVMYQGGTLDWTMTPGLQKESGAYDQSPSPKYFVEFDFASHYAWNDPGLAFPEQIVYYSVAFMDEYVRSLPRDADLTTSEHGVAALRFLGASDESGKPY